MKYGNKVVVVPFKEEEEAGLVDQIGEGVLLKTSKPKRTAGNNSIIKIFLRLAQIGGYNENGNIKISNDKFLPNTDVGALVEYAMTRGVASAGLQQFVKLLQEAGITEEMVVNDNVKFMLQQKKKSNEPAKFKPYVISKRKKPRLLDVSEDEESEELYQVPNLANQSYKRSFAQAIEQDSRIPKLAPYNEHPPETMTYRGNEAPPELEMYDGQNEDVFYNSKLNWDDKSSDDDSRSS